MQKIWLFQFSIIKKHDILNNFASRFLKKMHEFFQLYIDVLALIFLRKTKRALTLDLTFIYLLRPVHELELSDCPWLSVAGVRHFKLPQQVLRHVIFSQRIHHKALKYWNIIAMVNGGNRLVSVRSDVYLLLGFACGSMNEWVKMGKVSVHRLSPSLTSCSLSPWIWIWEESE